MTLNVHHVIALNVCNKTSIYQLNSYKLKKKKKRIKLKRQNLINGKHKNNNKKYIVTDILATEVENT